jgi:cell fate regulator YaaT (PSP1 superfamily)
MKSDDITLRGCAAQSVLENGGKCNPYSCNKLNVFNDLRNFPKTINTPDIVEIRFKNTRKSFYKNAANLSLAEGDMVAVEASPGHDIGTVSLTGELVREQMKRKGITSDSKLRVIYRKVKPSDVEKWENATGRENEIMLKARRITKRLNLEMKIGDVEFQGDGTKAIFYYIADNRVDFRELIKILAEEFGIRVEMRQIGARQEAGRIGGIGSCGRELCCSSWMSDFISVSTDSARDQQLSMNPQKLAGQCGKLKCCINYEKESYKEALTQFPPTINLETEAGTAYFMKIDVFRQLVWYSFDKNQPENVTVVSTDRVFEIIKMNQSGKKPEKLTDQSTMPKRKIEYEDLAGQESISRFDQKKHKKKKKKYRKDKEERENKDQVNP